MRTAETLLPKLNRWTATGPGRQSLTEPVDGSNWVLNLTADRIDSLGCLLWELTLTRSGAPATPNANLKKQALEAADRVTGLMEPLRFLELDELRNEALLRSESPAKRGGALAYYEVLMTGGRQITLRRYQRSSEKSQREQIAFALTHESIAKLAEDLVQPASA